MATEASTLPSPVVRQIDKQFLICSICLDRYNNPKVLPCLHTFCERYFHPDALLYFSKHLWHRYLFGLSAKHAETEVVLLKKMCQDSQLCVPRQCWFYCCTAQYQIAFSTDKDHWHIYWCISSCHDKNLFALLQVFTELHPRPQFDSVLPRVPSDLHPTGEGCGGTSEQLFYHQPDGGAKEKPRH